MFEAATNREEYCKLLAQKVYHIQKELEDKKNLVPIKVQVDYRCRISSYFAYSNLSFSPCSCFWQWPRARPPTDNYPSCMSTGSTLIITGASVINTTANISPQPSVEDK